MFLLMKLLKKVALPHYSIALIGQHAKKLFCVSFALQPGDNIIEEDAKEFERKLRAMDIFAEVNVSLQPDIEKPGAVILIVDTRDRTSIKVGGSGSFVGGVGTVGFTVSEQSLMGQGNIVTLGYSESTEGNNRLAFSYEDIHLFSNTNRGIIRFGETEDGEFYGLTFDSPFQYRGDNFSWSFRLDNEDKALGFIDNNDIVAAVPFSESEQVFTATWRSGSRQQRWLKGLVLRSDTTDYDAATGPQAGAVTVPFDFERTFAGFLIGYDKESAYKKLIGLDTVILPQDISLGYQQQLLTGISHRTEQDSSDQPEVFYQASLVQQLGNNNYINLSFDASVRWLDGQSQQRQSSMSLKAYALGHTRHKLAARLSYDNNFTRDGLPIQSRLGESDGLRGYENDSFAGAERIRLNLEDRILTGLQFATIRVGLLGFFDAGWLADKGESFASPYRSVGLGLRLGSKQLLGRNLIRVDLSFPLDNDEDDSPLLSIATGQLFTF